MIEKVNAVTGKYENEVIQYTGRAGENFTGCTRGTAAPYRGLHLRLQQQERIL